MVKKKFNDTNDLFHPFPLFLQDEYFAKYGGTVIPVQPNDVFFAFHAVILTIISISQCFIYEVGLNKSSKEQGSKIDFKRFLNINVRFCVEPVGNYTFL